MILTCKENKSNSEILFNDVISLVLSRSSCNSSYAYIIKTPPKFNVAMHYQISCEELVNLEKEHHKNHH